jgi:DNA-binding response OmpR family regulator
VTATILVVDDDEQLRRSVGRLLERAGYACAYASEGDEVLSAAVALRPDLILLDADMPRTSGMDALAQLRRDPRTRLTPVIFLTGRSDLSDRIMRLLGRMDGYLAKPAAPSELLARVKQAVSAR